MATPDVTVAMLPPPDVVGVSPPDPRVRSGGGGGGAPSAMML